MSIKFYRCLDCGNIITFAKSSGVPVYCCGKPMTELVPGVTDGAYEKHVPVISQEGNAVTVTVGAVAHPMLDVHYIEWIVLVTKEGVQRKALKPGDEPKAVFYIGKNDAPVEAYEYCNLHYLWKSV
jgi:superoxide reductase